MKNIIVTKIKKGECIMSRTITPLQMNIVGDDGEVKGQYSPETYAETVTTGSVKKSESLELPGTDPSETLTDTIAKVKLYLDNVSSIASEKREVVDSPDDNSSNIPSTRATASLKASLDAINAIVTKNKEDIANKAPIAHADAGKTYGGGTEDLYGHVKTTDKYVYTNEDETAPTAADSVAASPKAVADAYTALDTGKAPVSHASTDTKYGSASLIDYGHVKASDTYKVAIEDGDAEHGVVASQKAVNDMYKDLSSNQETGIVSRAPIMHADAERTYGAGTESLYGHVKISDNYDMEDVETNGNAASGMAASLFALHRSNAALQAVVDTKLPSTHAAEKATAEKFSHVKLTDTYETSQGAAADGVGASSKALADSFAKLNASISAAQKSIVTLNSDKATAKVVSSEDTNKFIEVGFYRANEGNTCTNKPDNVNNFGLINMRCGDHAYRQIMAGTDRSGATRLYTRVCTNDTWSDWSDYFPMSITGKSNTSGTADVAKSVDWANITGKPVIIDSKQYSDHVNAFNVLNNKFNNLKSILRSYLNVKHPSARAVFGYGILSNGWGYMNSDESVATLRGLILSSPAGTTYSANAAVKVATISEAYPNTNFVFYSANAYGYQQGTSSIFTFTVSATRASNNSIDIYLTCISDYPYQQALVIYFNDLGWLTSATNIITSN
jgi:hypothetical protein